MRRRTGAGGNLDQNANTTPPVDYLDFTSASTHSMLLFTHVLSPHSHDHGSETLRDGALHARGGMMQRVMCG